MYFDDKYTKKIGSLSLQDRAQSAFDKLLKNKQHKWLLYIIDDEKSLIDLQTHTVVLHLIPSNNKVNISCNSITIFDSQVFDDLFMSYIGRGNIYLRQEKGKPRESLKIPLRDIKKGN